MGLLIKKTCKSQQGFTLIEAIVSASVFAVVVTSAMGVYMATLKLDAKTKAERAVQQNARFIMEYLGKEVRNGSIDYAGYTSTGINIANDSTNLFLINQALENEWIYLSGSNIVLSKAAGDTNLNSSGVRVTKLSFSVAPTSNPFLSLSSSPPNVQPNVVVTMELTSNYGNRGQNKAVMNVQSTFATRQYPSRDN